MKKAVWVLDKAIRFCFPYIMVNIAVRCFTTAISLSVNIINKNIVNMLNARSAMGTMGSAFIGLVILYLFLYFIQGTSSFITVFGYNFYRFKVDSLFHKIFMWKTYQTPQKSFFDHEFMEKYSFVSGNTSKISEYISVLINILFTDMGTIFCSMILFALYEPVLILYSAVIVVGTVALSGFVSKKEYNLDKKQIVEQRYHDYY